VIREAEVVRKSGYSARSARMGSTRVARSAGNQQAKKVIDPRSKVTMAKVSGSVAFTP